MTNKEANGNTKLPYSQANKLNVRITIIVRKVAMIADSGLNVGSINAKNKPTNNSNKNSAPCV